MIDSANAVAVADALDGLGVRWCCDGGWGIDALVGEQTRDHADLDVVVDAARVEDVRAALWALGYGVVADEAPTRVVLGDGPRRIDLHLVTYDSEGGGVQALPGGRSFRYPPEGLAGEGRIGGRSVPCLSAATQVLVHTGYEPDADDRADLALLRDRGFVSVPPPYASVAPLDGGGDVVVRTAAAGDGAAIAVTRRRSWHAAYRGLLPDAVLEGMDLEQSWRYWAGAVSAPPSPRHAVTVVGAPGEVVGFAALGPEDDAPSIGEVFAIYLDPTAWSLGLGHALLTDAQGRLAAHGFREAVLWVLDGNVRARAFYERVGWHADGATRVGGGGGAHRWTEVRYRRTLVG